MGLQNIGFSGLILIVIVLLLVFGPSKLPEIGRAFGRSLKEFKEATRGIMEDSAPRNAAETRADQPVARPVAAVEPIEFREEAKEPK